MGTGWESGDPSKSEAGLLNDSVLIDEKTRGEGNGGDVHFAALGDFRKGAHSREIARDVNGDKEFVFLENGGAVAGEKFVERDRSLVLSGL